MKGAGDLERKARRLHCAQQGRPRNTGPVGSPPSKKNTAWAPKVARGVQRRSTPMPREAMHHRGGCCTAPGGDNSTVRAPKSGESASTICSSGSQPGERPRRRGVASASQGKICDVSTTCCQTGHGYPCRRTVRAERIRSNALPNHCVTPRTEPSKPTCGGNSPLPTPAEYRRLTTESPNNGD